MTKTHLPKSPVAAALALMTLLSGCAESERLPGRGASTETGNISTEEVSSPPSTTVVAPTDTGQPNPAPFVAPSDGGGIDGAPFVDPTATAHVTATEETPSDPTGSPESKDGG